MKSFGIKILIFVVCLFVLDRLAGVVFPYLEINAKGGQTYRHKYITDKTEEDILIFGSSRGVRHYNPGIISDSLGMSSYNCAEDGNGIILSYGRYSMIRGRYSPKVIIYDINPDFDVLSNDNTKYLKFLKTSYDRPGISDIFSSISSKENIKMKSNLYRYNSSFNIILDLLNSPEGFQGYVPLHGEIETLPEQSYNGENQMIQYDSLKLSYWDKFLDLTSGTRVIFAISPTWNGMDSTLYKPIIEKASSRGIPIINFANDPKYNFNPHYFKDGKHLNSVGADEFTKDIAHVLKSNFGGHGS